jgi:hypothetical protein
MLHSHGKSVNSLMHIALNVFNFIRTLHYIFQPIWPSLSVKIVVLETTYLCNPVSHSDRPLSLCVVYLLL